MKKRLFICLLMLWTITAISLFWPITAVGSGDEFGDSITWILDESTGTLTLSGEGEMRDWYPNVKWYQGDEVKHVVIEEGITYVGTRAFLGWKNLQTVVIPDSVTRIGAHAFSYSSVNQVTLGNGVEVIEESAFYESKVQQIVLPDSLKTIEKNAFYLTPLTKINIPQSVTYIGEYAFQFTKIQEITIPESITVISEGLFQSCNMLERINLHDGITEIGAHAFDGCGMVSNLRIPKNVTVIGDYAYSNTPLTEAIIPEGVTVINDYVFHLCRQLENVVLHDGITKIGDAAFSYCVVLTQIDIPDSVTEVGRGVFSDCTGLETVNLGNGITVLPTYTFTACNKLKSVTIPDSVITIQNMAFHGGDMLETIYIGKSVANIEAEAFNGCDILREFVVSAESKTFCAVDGILYSKDKTVLHQIPDGYSGSYSVLPGTVEIAGGAAGYCNGLTEVHIPKSVVSIGNGAFGNCEALETVLLAEGLETIEKDAFEYCKSLKQIVLPATVNTIGCSAFNGCSSLEKIVFLGDVPELGIGVFPRGVDAYYPEGNPTWEGGGKEHVDYLNWPQDPPVDPYSGYWGENVTWKLDIESGMLTFSGTGDMSNESAVPWWDYREHVVHVVIEDGVTSIGHNAFGGMHNLEDVIIPKSVTTIKNYAFDTCRKLTQIDLHDGITFIGGCAFRECSGLTSIRIPAGVTSVSFGSFSGCSGLTEVIFHDNLLYIGSDAFFHCVGLKSVVIPDSVKELDSAFRFCVNLSSVDLGDGVESLSGTFSYCTALTEIVIPDSVKKITTNAFSNCKNLRYVYFGAGLEEVSGNSFDYCDLMEQFVMNPENPNLFVDEYGVMYTKDQTKLLLFPWAFKGDYQVISATTTIVGYAAWECAGLTGLTIPETVTEIERYAFRDCKSLEYVRFSEGLVKIGESAFDGCESLAEVVFPRTLEELSNAFSFCTNLKSITFCGLAPKIGENTFYNVKADVYYPGNAVSWEGKTKGYGGYLNWLPVYCDNAHVEVETAAIAPTCTKSGKTAGKHCAICGIAIVEQKIINSLGHTFGEWEVVKESTAEETGLAKRTCSTCGKVENMTLNAVMPPILSDATEGSCGENVRWEFSDGLLSLTGTGEMETYLDETVLPWAHLRDQVTEIIIGEGITNLSHKAFHSFTNLKKVTIGNTVSRIEGQVFRGCINLLSVEMPADLEYIGDFSFMDCKKLQFIVIPASVKQIDVQAFRDCKGMYAVYFEGNPPDMDYPFLNVKATVYYPAGNTKWHGGTMKQYGGKLIWEVYCPFGHAFGDWVVLKQPTLEEEGLQEHVCLYCQALEQQEIPMLQPTEPPVSPTTPTFVETLTPATRPPAVPTEPTDEPKEPWSGVIEDVPYSRLVWGILIGAAAIALIAGSIIIYRVIKKCDP